MNKDMKKRLESYINTDILISVYTDVDELDKFNLGFLLQIDDDYLLMNMVNKFGEEDGFCIINLDGIIIYDDDKLYSGKIKKLFAIKNQSRKEIKDLDKCVINSLLRYAKSNNYLVEVNEDNSYFGFVSYYSDEILELNLVDIYAKRIGTACIDIEHITNITCQDKYSKDIEMLIKDNNDEWYISINEQ